MNILIPMAGEGKRFKDAGFDLPKPLIPVCGRPMIEVAVNSLGVDGQWIFVVRNITAPTLQFLSKLRPGCRLNGTNGKTTDGAACSALLAKYSINNDDPLLIADCDAIMRWDAEKFNKAIQDLEHDGLLVTYNTNRPQNCYLSLDENGFVTRAAEKEVISNISTNGICYWKRGSDFVRSAEKMIAANKRVNNEFYISQTYNELIAEGKKIVTYHIEASEHWSVGSPQDLDIYEKMVAGRV